MFADATARAAYLQRVLANARIFQRLLRDDVTEFGETRYYSVQNIYDDTPWRAVLVEEDDGSWKTLFTGDSELDAYMQALITRPGDGHATPMSQDWLSPQERAAALSEPFYSRSDHFNMVLDRAVQRRLLDFLVDE